MHQRDQRLTVVQIGPRDSGGQGQTGPLGDQVDLRARQRRSTGFGPVRSPFSAPACSPSRSRTGTSPTRHGSPARRGPGGGAWPIRGPSSTRQSADEPSPLTGRTRQKATAATCSPTWPRTRSRPALRGRRRRCRPPPRSRRRLRHHPLKQLPQLIRTLVNDPHHDRELTQPNEMTSNCTKAYSKYAW
ncbi:hypothetical protein BSAF29S_05016 [Bacillus safensis subsp. safensis]